LRLRNELHFHAGQANDVLSRSEQLRIAESSGQPDASIPPSDGLLPVERFMQEYFRHTNRVSHVATKFLAKATTRQWFDVALTHLLGHRIESDYLVGPVGLMTTRRGRSKLHKSLAGIMQLVDLANLHDVPIAASAWEDIRREAGSSRNPRTGALFRRKRAGISYRC
jgi:[protein-PII] uridylyltransferase